MVRQLGFVADRPRRCTFYRFAFEDVDPGRRSALNNDFLHLPCEYR